MTGGLPESDQGPPSRHMRPRHDCMTRRPPSSSEGPNAAGAAHAWAALGHLREAERRLEEQARTHRLKARA